MYPPLLGYKVVIKRMEVDKILQLDCREKENREKIQRVLKDIRPLSKYSDLEIIPFEKVEKLVTVISKRYNMRVGYIVPDVWSNADNTIWRAVIINDTSCTKMNTVCGLSVYEMFAKTAILMYSIRDKIGRRIERI